MDKQQEVLAEVEAFLDFQIQHTQRHRLKKFLVSVEKASSLLNKIRALRGVDTSVPPPFKEPVSQKTQAAKVVAQAAEPVWDQNRYNAWFIQEIERLQGQVATLEQKLTSE